MKMLETKGARTRGIGDTPLIFLWKGSRVSKKSDQGIF